MEHEVGVVAVEGMSDDGADVVGKCTVVELRKVNVLEGEVPSLPIRSDRRRPIRNRASPGPIAQGDGRAAGAAAELGVQADEQLQQRRGRWLSDRAVGADQGTEPAVHVTVDEPDIDGLGRYAPFGEHFPHPRGLCRADEVLSDRGHRSYTVGGFCDPGSRPRRGPFNAVGRGGHYLLSLSLAAIAFGFLFRVAGRGLVSIASRVAAVRVLTAHARSPIAWRRGRSSWSR